MKIPVPMYLTDQINGKVSAMSLYLLRTLKERNRARWGVRYRLGVKGSLSYLMFELCVKAV